MTTLALPSVRTRQFSRPLLTGATINYEGAGTATATGAVASAAVDMPDGVQLGDLLVALFWFGGTPTAIGKPNGWTALDLILTGTLNQKVYWRVAGAEEPASYTWTVAPSVIIEGVIVRISGANTHNPLILGTFGSATGTAVTMPAITMDTPDSVLLCHVSWGGTRDIASDGAVMTELADGTSSAMYVQELTGGPGTTGTRPFTLSSSASWNAIAIGVRD
jgi:hypothetical protein